MFSTKMVANAYIRVYTIKPCKHVCFQRSTFVRYVVSIDQERKPHLLPLLLSATGTTIFAEVGDNGNFLSEPLLTGFKPFKQLKFAKGCYGSVGCFCRQKRLHTLFGVTHINSGVVFLLAAPAWLISTKTSTTCGTRKNTMLCRHTSAPSTS